MCTLLMNVTTGIRCPVMLIIMVCIMWMLMDSLCIMCNFPLMQSSTLVQDNGLCNMQTKLFLLLLLVPSEGNTGPKKNKPKDPSSQPDEKPMLHVETDGGPDGSHRRRTRLGPGRGPGLLVPRLTLNPDHHEDTEEESDGETALGTSSTLRKNLEDTLQDLLDKWDQELDKLRRQLADNIDTIHRDLFNY
ncbi:E4 early protein [Bos taurus papillomavirus 41]|nr:E4 early protein [Bos taurus papillomavirus 41]